MTSLITGGAGFVGSHLAARLIHEGETVRVLDNFSSGRQENLAESRGEVEVVHGDLRDEAAVRRAVAGVDVVFHQAADPSVPRSIDDPQTSFDINITGTLNLLQAARDAGCRRVVFASSCAVYGDSPVSPKHEAMVPAPLSPYAVSKLTGEHLCAVFTQVYGLEAVALRYFNVFGPRQDPASAYAAVIPRFVAALQAGESPVIFGDGEQSRDFVYVDDVVEANLRAATAAGVAGSVFNVASGQAVTLNAMLADLASLTGVDIPPRHEPARPGDIRHSLADVTLARERLGFVARIPFLEGLARVVASVGMAKGAPALEPRSVAI